MWSLMALATDVVSWLEFIIIDLHLNMSFSETGIPLRANAV